MLSNFISENSLKKENTTFPVKKRVLPAPVGVAQLVGVLTYSRRVVGSIPNQGIDLLYLCRSK